MTDGAPSVSHPGFNGADFSLLREVDGSFQVFWWTDLEVGLERTQA